MKVRYVLVIRADGGARIAKRPRIMPDEIGFPVVVDIPDAWGRVDMNRPLSVTLPEPPYLAAVGLPITHTPEVEAVERDLPVRCPHCGSDVYGAAEHPHCAALAEARKAKP